MSTQGEGWYADPSDAGQLRWWDGQQWTAHTHHAVVPGRPPLGVGWPGLGRWVQVVLALTVPVSVAVFLINLDRVDVWRRLAADPASVTLEEAQRSDSLVLWSLLEIPMLLGCGVLFIAWLYQAHRSDRMDPTFQKRSSGWAIGAWFVPVVNFWFPFQVVSDLRDGARGDAREPSALVQWLWWLGFIVYTLASRASGRLYGVAEAVPDSDPAQYVDRLETAVLVENVSEVVSVVTAVLAIVMVRQMTAWVRSSPPAMQQLAR